MEGHQFTLNKSPGFVIIAAAVFFCALQSCSDRGNLSDNQSTLPTTTDSADETPLLQLETESALRTLMLQFPEYLDVGLRDVVEKAEALQISTDNFMEHTNAETLAAVRAAWLSAHNAYEQTTLYRKLFELFAEESAVLQLTGHQYFIDHWPIYAGYIDYLDSYPGSGLVNDMTVALTPESARAQHGLFDLHEVTLGFHSVYWQMFITVFIKTSNSRLSRTFVGIFMNRIVSQLSKITIFRMISKKSMKLVHSLDSVANNMVSKSLSETLLRILAQSTPNVV